MTLGPDVSRETTERLDLYLALLKKWNAKINLVAATDDATLWRRHFVDCWQVAEIAGNRVSQWMDLGSGAGFPGLVVAVRRPEIHVVCVESDKRKAMFLREVIRALELDSAVVARRIEDIAPLNAATVSARALAPLPRLLDLVSRHLAEGGEALLMKGASWREELEMARETWHFSCEAVPSRTNPHAVILKIGDLRRAARLTSGPPQDRGDRESKGRCRQDDDGD